MIYKAKHNPYRIVEMFEEEVANYTGAPYAVAVDNCTDAILLCNLLINTRHKESIKIPSKTYLSVPQSIMQAGGTVIFDENLNDWKGCYELGDTNIYDAAKRFTSDMYISGSFMCLSFHIKKHLPIGKGGMILTHKKYFYEALKELRYEGRGPVLYHNDDIQFMGYNMYMTPEQAARGLMLMQNIPLHNEDLPEEQGYKHLYEYTAFKHCKVIKRND